MTRGIRGAITVDNNTVEDIKNATVTLLKEMIEKNEIELDTISHVIFTLTKDIDKAYPAKFARTELNFNNVPMMCYQELNIENSLEKCLRILLVVNTEKQQTEIKHVYLKGASVLRPDLKY